MAFAGLVLVSGGCGIYSFTGASISPDVKTVQINYFDNQADLVQPTLSQTFTTALQDKFINQTSLEIVESGGDLVLEGHIQTYRTEPMAIQGDQTAALNKLTIGVFVRFTNKIEPEQNFEETFSQFAQYPSSESLSSVEQGLIEEISTALVEDIFNKSVVNW